MLVGTIVILFVFFRYGFPFLINLSLTISKLTHPETQEKKKGSYVQPPIFNPILSGTNSAQLSLSGNALANQTINLYLNDSFNDKTTVKKNGTFSIPEVTLKTGENTIKAKAITNDGSESNFSDELIIIYKNSAPSLTIDSPKDGQAFSKDDNSVNISGKTDSKVTININDLRVIVNDNGSFSYNLPLKNGENKLVIVAVDEAGNKTEKELKVNYSP